MTPRKRFQGAGMNAFNHYSLGSCGERHYDLSRGRHHRRMHLAFGSPRCPARSGPGDHRSGTCTPTTIAPGQEQRRNGRVCRRCRTRGLGVELPKHFTEGRAMKRFGKLAMWLATAAILCGQVRGGLKGDTP